MTEFIKGLQLSKDFYKEVGKPILESHFPGLEYSAALIGHGSEVLGFDTAISSDHDWGPRFIVFLKPSDHKQFKKALDKIFSKELPKTYKGFSISPDNISDVRAEETFSNSKHHRIEIVTIQSYFENEIGINPQNNLSEKDWLMLPSQKLLSVTKGEVFFDGLNELNSIRQKLKYYPQDLWIYVLASQWKKISQEEPFMGRTAHVGDELGSRIISARLVKYMMELCFMMEKQYIPYMKWFGTAFAQLDSAKRLSSTFNRILDRVDWKIREEYFADAYEIIATMHNDLKLTEPLNTKVTSFHGRPYQVIQAESFAKALRNAISNEVLRDMPLVGAINQFVDNTDFTENERLVNQIKQLL